MVGFFFRLVAEIPLTLSLSASVQMHDYAGNDQPDMRVTESTEGSATNGTDPPIGREP